MLKRSIPALAALLITLPLASCGGGGGSTPAELSEQGALALGSGDYDEALTSYREALQGLEPGTPDYVRAKMGEIEALIHVDSAEARTTFLALEDTTARDFATVGNKMTSAKAFQDAVLVLDEGIKRFPDDEKLPQLVEVVKAEAEDAGDEGAMKALEGLGYL